MNIEGPFKLLNEQAMAASANFTATVEVPIFGANAIWLVGWDSSATTVGTLTVNSRWKIADGLAFVEGAPLHVTSITSKITNVADLRTGGIDYLLPTTTLGTNHSALFMAKTYSVRVNRDATVAAKVISLWAYVVRGHGMMLNAPAA